MFPTLFICQILLRNQVPSPNPSCKYLTFRLLRRLFFRSVIGLPLHRSPRSRCFIHWHKADEEKIDKIAVGTGVQKNQHRTKDSPSKKFPIKCLTNTGQTIMIVYVNRMDLSRNYVTANKLRGSSGWLIICASD
jgi:hypothetical protein